MNNNQINVRNLLTGLSNRYGRICPPEFDIFLIQTLHSKVGFDWYVDYYACQLLIDKLYDVMEQREYTEEVASELRALIKNTLIE